MNFFPIRIVRPRMKGFPLLTTACALAAAMLGSSCASGPGEFVGNESGRKSQGNAPLVGPNAGDLIDQSRYDYERREYLDRIDRNKPRRHSDRRY